jgi:hypothetical protein
VELLPQASQGARTRQPTADHLRRLHRARRKRRRVLPGRRMVRGSLVPQHLQPTYHRPIAPLLNAIHASEAAAPKGDPSDRKNRAGCASPQPPNSRTRRLRSPYNRHYAFPERHSRRIRTNNPLERLLREIGRRTRGHSPAGRLPAARLGHVAGRNGRRSDI